MVCGLINEIYKKTLGKLSSHSAPWYLIGCAAALPDLICINVLPTLHVWLFSIRIPFLIPSSLGVYCVTALCAKRHEVAIRAAFLGVMTALGIVVCIHGDLLFKGFGMYLVFLSWFHFSEYFFIEITSPEKAKISSFMLNHSLPYNIALAASVFEFFTESYLYPGMKEMPALVILGFIICVLGESLRKRAMYVCGQNFDHLVQSDLKSKQHRLITHDVYRYIQHPSYTGWFIFTIGTQIILCNPFCLMAFPCIMYRFFEHRVRTEEPALFAKHGATYQHYRDKTPRFIPYVW